MSLSYKSNSVVGGPLDPQVIKQLEARKSIVSKRVNRTADELMYLNSTTGWVKLTSAVDIYIGDDLNGNPQYTSFLAGDNILLSGTLADNNTRLGGFRDVNSAYNKSSVNGYRPMAGITGFSVSAKNTFGTLRAASVDFKANSIEQLDNLEQLFLRPGMSVLLEWGHSLSIDNKGKLVSTIETFPNFLQGQSSKKIAETIVELKATKNSYNYDAVYGFIKNFSWSYNLDGGYDCRVEIISQGELIESLQLAIYPSSATTAISTAAGFNTSQNTTALHSYLNTIKNANTRRYWTGPLGPGDISDQSIHQALEASLPDLYSKVNQELEDVGRSMNVLHVEFGGTAKESYGQWTRYIQISTLMELLNAVFTIKDQNGDNIVSFFYGQTENITPYFTFPQHFALDPYIAVVPKPTSSNETTSYRYKIQDAANFLSGDETDILNIYLNVDYILGCYDSVVTGEDLTDKTLVSFLKQVLKGLTETLGEINDFDIHFEEDEFRYYIIDRRVVPSNNDLSDSKIDLVGLNSTLENLSFTSKLSGNITTMMAIAAQAASTNAGTDMLMMQKWNDGLQDRHLATKGIGKAIPINSKSFKTSAEVDKTELARLVNFINTVNAGTSYYISYSVEDINGLKPAHKYIMNKLSEVITKSTKTNPGGLIPFELSFTIKGISGLKIGQAFKLADESIIPSKYRGNIAFLITKVDHTISSNRWVTNVGTQMILSTAIETEIEAVDVDFLEAQADVLIAEAAYEPGAPFDRVDVNTLSTSQNGINLIKKFEGFRSAAYKDPGSGNLPITIGYGTTRINGRPIELGTVITKPQAETFLKIDVLQFEASVKKLVKVPVSQNEYDALVSFAYNAGAGNLQGSTLLKKLNQKDYDGASNEFTKWTKAGGKVLPGLVNRRNAEKSVFRVNLQITGV